MRYMHKNITLVLLLIILLTGCTETTPVETICEEGTVLIGDSCEVQSMTDILFEKECTSEEVTLLMYTDFFNTLEKRDVKMYIDSNADDTCAIASLVQKVSFVHPDDEYREILINRLMDTPLGDVDDYLIKVQESRSFDIEASNYAIRADNVSEYVDVLTTNYAKVASGGWSYEYFYFTMTNKWVHENQFVEKNQIVFVGSSLVQQQDFEFHLPEFDIVNRGIGGDYSDGMFDRIEISAYELNPSKLFLYVGGNDASRGHTVDQTASKVEALIQDILTHMDKEDVYLISPYPINETIKFAPSGAHYGFDNAALTRLGNLYEQLCTTYDITFVDIADVLKDTEGNLIAEWTRDGLHFKNNGTDPGYAALSEAMKPYLSE